MPATAARFALTKPSVTRKMVAPTCQLSQIAIRPQIEPTNKKFRALDLRLQLAGAGSDEARAERHAAAALMASGDTAPPSTQ